MAGWSQLRGGFPATHGTARDAAILDIVNEGHFVPPAWSEITTHAAGHSASFGVSSDAFKLGEPGDSVRMIVNHRTAQAVADLLGVVLPTPLLADAAAAQAGLFLDASDHFWPKTPQQTPINTTKSAEQHSAELDAAIAAAGGEGLLVRGPWKIWANHQRLLFPQLLKYGKQSGLNYGAQTALPVGQPVVIDGKTINPGPYAPATPIDLRVWQTPGAAHDVSHDDASQKLDLVARSVHVQGPLAPGGAIMDIEEVSLHPVLWPLVSALGPIPMRHPWLPVCTSLDEGGSCPAPPGPVGPTEPPVTPAGFSWARLAPVGAVLIVAAAWYGSS